MPNIKLNTWDRVERRSAGSRLVKIISGKAIIQCPAYPEGRFVGPGGGGYFVGQDECVVIIALEPTEISISYHEPWVLREKQAREQ